MQCIVAHEEYPPCPLCGVPIGLVERHRRWHIRTSTFIEEDWEAFAHEWLGLQSVE